MRKFIINVGLGLVIGGLVGFGFAVGWHLHISPKFQAAGWTSYPAAGAAPPVMLVDSAAPADLLLFIGVFGGAGFGSIVGALCQRRAATATPQVQPQPTEKSKT